jgi:hypothetical protein
MSVRKRYPVMRLSRREKMTWMTTIITVGFVSIAIFYYRNGMFLKLDFPNNTFLPHPPPFGDLQGPVGQWIQFKFNVIGYGLAYFPASYLVVNAFAIPTVWWGADVASLIFITQFSMFVAVYTFINLRSSDFVETIGRVVVITFMTYPMLFALHTANIEAVVFVCLCLFVALYSRGQSAISTIPLGLAIAMKAVPAVFLVLFLADRKFRDVFYLGAVVLLFSLLPLLIFEGGIRDGFGQYFANFNGSQKMYFDLMVIGIAGNHFGHSLLNAIRVIMGDSFPPMDQILKPYMAFAVVSFGLISAYIILAERVYWKRVTLLVICMCLLPYTSTDYKLLHFLIPIFLLINHRDNNEAPAPRSDGIYVSLLTLLLVPKSYFYFHNDPISTLNGVFNAALMIVLLLLIVLTGIVWNGIFWRKPSG